jgi:hypothetical protein
MMMMMLVSDLARACAIKSTVAAALSPIALQSTVHVCLLPSTTN